MTKPQINASEKQQFFADLDHLDNTDDDTEDELDIKQSPHVRRPDLRSGRPPRSSKGQQHSERSSHDSVNQTPLTGSSKAPIILHDTPDHHAHRVKEPMPSASPPTRPAPTIGAKSVGLPKTHLKRQNSNLTRDEGVKRAKKTQNEIQLVSEEKRVFNGLVFFFVPNDDIVKSRRQRILRAKEHGAKRATAFDHNVTHVIVEQNITYQEAAKAFPNRYIPKETILVRTSWLGESLNNLYLRDVYQSRFRLRGAPEPSRQKNDQCLPSGSRNVTEEQPQLGHSLNGEAGDNKPNVEDELESIVKQVKENGRLPSDIESDGGFSLSSTVSDSAYDSNESLDEERLWPKPAPEENKGFQCMESNTSKSSASNPNHHTITVLQEMASYYDRTGDHWRKTAYRKAISALRKQTKLVATRAQAQAVPQIGTSIAEKIEEIVNTTRLRRLDNARSDPQDQVLQLFTGIYGVGHKQASLWVAQGHRTLSDLLEKVTLTSNQKIGIDHYADFSERIPREEVAQHGEIVRQACHKVDSGLEIIIGGSFRRGSSNSSDIDLVITKSDADIAHIRTLVLQHAVPSLFDSGFLKCTLASSSSVPSSPDARSSATHTTCNTNRGGRGGSKFHGASALPPPPHTPKHDNPWRRIDLLFVPSASLGAGLLYFTGNDIFNRSMRLLASKKNMRLNQHGLYRDVARKQGRVKDTQGTLVEGRSEKRIFEILGVPWREPWERIC